MLDSEPTEHTAIEHLDAIGDDLPAMLSAAGAPGARASLAGDTAIASASVDAMKSELVRVGIAALAVNLLLLALFLRALLAPLYLLVANALTVAATLGITTWVFQDLLDQGQLVYYVPFATAVLLLALGSDYNIYLVGRHLAGRPAGRDRRGHPHRDARGVAQHLGRRPDPGRRASGCWRWSRSTPSASSRS